MKYCIMQDNVIISLSQTKVKKIGPDIEPIKALVQRFKGLTSSTIGLTGVYIYIYN